MEILEKAHHQNMALITTGMINVSHYIDGSCHKATIGHFIGHLNGAYFLHGHNGGLIAKCIVIV